MNNQDIYATIYNGIHKLTDIDPNIYFGNNSHNILVCFHGNIPSETTSLEIQKMLRKFGNTVYNSLRKYNYVEFIVVEN